jgi:hypothetical protein
MSFSFAGMFWNLLLHYYPALGNEAVSENGQTITTAKFIIKSSLFILFLSAVRK